MKTAIIGVGAMGGAIAEGMLHSCKVNPADIIAANPHTDKLWHLVDAGVMVTSDNKAAAAKADVVIVAVKPWLAEDVMKDLKTVMDYRRQVLVSVVAGVSLISDETEETLRRLRGLATDTIRGFSACIFGRNLGGIPVVDWLVRSSMLEREKAASPSGNFK